MFNLTEEACKKIDEMIKAGYEFMLTYDNSEGPLMWLADFTRQIPEQGFDNHEPGKHPDNPSMAILEAFNNHKVIAPLA
jgi:hypothetical protein